MNSMSPAVDAALVPCTRNNCTPDERAHHSSIAEPDSSDSAFDYNFYRSDLSLMSSWVHDKAFYPSTVTYSLTFILGVVGNCLVVAALFIDRKTHYVTSAFMASLAVADLVFLLICIPYEASVKFMFHWVGGMALCKLAGFAEMLSALASILNLTAVSVERYIVVVHPMKSRSWCTMGNTYKTIAAVWTVSIVLSSPLIHTMETRRGRFYDNESVVIVTSCADTNFGDDVERVVFGWYQLLVLFLLPVLIILYCYVQVIRVLWISTLEHAELTNTDGGRVQMDQCEERLCRTSAPESSKRPRSGFGCQVTRSQSADVREARKQIIRMLMTIIGVFFICWGPKLVLTVMKRHDLHILQSDDAFYTLLVINLLPYIQSCMNPIIYCFMSNKFRRSMRIACRCRGRCCGRQGSPLESDAAGKRRISGATSLSTASRSIYSPGGARPSKSATFISIVSEC